MEHLDEAAFHPGSRRRSPQMAPGKAGESETIRREGSGTSEGIFWLLEPDEIRANYKENCQSRENCYMISEKDKIR